MPWVLAAGCTHFAYKFFLTYAYDRGDLSRVYPIARGAAPMIVALFGAAFLADAVTDEILGVHMVGPQVSELIAEAVVAMEFKASAEDIARICHAHPSLSEATKEAALAVDKRTLNF